MTRSCTLGILVLAVAGCGTARSMSAGRATVSTESKTLTRSLFARSPSGQLTEEALQEILGAPLSLDLPARVGVLPIIPAEDWRGPSPDHAMASQGMHEMAERLRDDPSFTLVTEMMPIPSGALGMEALREVAARYKLRYIVLYRENVVTRRRANGWAVGYLTGVGALFLPGTTLHVDGYVEASLFDVKSGLLLFTARRPVTARRDSTVWHRDDKLAAMQRKLAVHVAPPLAGDVLQSTAELTRAAELERDRGDQPAATPAAAIADAGPRGSLPPTHVGDIHAANPPNSPNSPEAAADSALTPEPAATTR